MIPAEASLKPKFLVTPDGTKFRAALFEPSAQADARGVCVLLNGQSEFIEKYFEVIDALRGRGFFVATLDWHNQGGSPRPLPDPLKVHVRDFSEYDAVLDALLEKIVAPISPKPPLALAHSMGGHILLRKLHKDQNVFRAAILSAPMIAIEMGGFPDWFAARTASFMVTSGRAADWVWGVNVRDPLTDSFENNPVTSDRKRWDDSHDFLRAHPELRVVGPTWGWMNAAMRSMHEMTNRDYALTIKTPVLTFGAGLDRICRTPPAREFATRLPLGKYVELADSKHEILMERDAIRKEFWKEFDAFVANT